MSEKQVHIWIHGIVPNKFWLWSNTSESSKLVLTEVEGINDVVENFMQPGTYGIYTDKNLEVVDIAKNAIKYFQERGYVVMVD